jgi:lipid-A-disaccharide synthase
MIVAGEASGDLYGARLARELLTLDATVSLFGIGSSLMREAGVQLLYDPTSISAIGFAEVLQSVQTLRRLLRRCGAVMQEQRPDVLVLLDFPEFNMRLAHIARKQGIPVVYYICPSVWAWRRGRAKKIARLADCVCAVFPFEVGLYQGAGARVLFVGHPLLDIVHPRTERAALLPQLQLDADKPFFALLPGSREQEVSSLLPPMLAAAQLIAQEVPGAQFAVPFAHTVSRQWQERLAHTFPAAVPVKGRTYDVLAAADVAIVASGTVTLEAAILGTPMVMVYKLASSTYHIAKILVKTPYVALPNVVADREIVRELLQQEACPEQMAAETLKLWYDKGKNAKMRRDLARVKARLGQPGAPARAARAVMAVARGEDFMPFGLTPIGDGGSS